MSWSGFVRPSLFSTWFGLVLSVVICSCPVLVAVEMMKSPQNDEKELNRDFY